MKKIILMFVVLITGITNAQTFDFGCDVSVRDAREAQLAALVGQHNVTSMTHFESDPGSTPAYVGASYVQNGSPFTFGLSTSIGLIEDITDWGTKYSELVAKLIADSGIEPTTHAHRAGVLTSYNSIDGISNIEVKVDNPINLSVATVYLEWELNGVAQDTYYFSATNPTVDSNGQVPGDLSYYEPGQFETNRERLYNKLIEHISTLTPFEEELKAIYGADAPPTELGTIINDAALAVNHGGTIGSTPRVNFIKSLAYFNVTVSTVFDDNPTVANLSNGNAVPNVGTNSNLNGMSRPQFAVFALEVIKAFWHIGTPNYVDYAALRTTRINELDALDITGVSVAHSTQSNGNDSFSVTRPGDQIVINADWYGPGLVENHTDEEFADLKDAVIASREELNPANAIYEFTPSQFQIASLQEKLDKAYDIAKANDDINAVSGSLLKGIVHGEKITLRIKAKNYPLEYLEEMAHDADYEGWKTLIDRVLYLVKTGDGSERTTRENHINGIAGNISVQDLNGGDDDWAVAWNDLPFIYGGSDENDHDPSYVDNNTSRVFAGYHQDNIGLLPGILYEALLVEVHRINGYVIAADALRRHTDGGINKEREEGIKALLTGNASFHENASAEWFILNSDVTVWSNSKYGPLCDVEGYLWLGVMDNYSFRYMYIIIRNELIRNDDSIRYYNNVNQNIYCN